MSAADPIRALRECRFALKAVEYRENMQADGTDGHLSCPECGASPGAHIADCKVSSAIASAEAALAEHETSGDGNAAYRDGWRAGSEAMQRAIADLAAKGILSCPIPDPPEGT